MEDILILGIGVSLKKNDGVLRFEKYCQIFNSPYIIVGDGKFGKVVICQLVLAVDKK